ncbi:DUF6671 family protein [Dermatobacter hominis]|uniref:DUF6671 family protein n=1 Tax=Dermatobacter hominis TaxID=2884263 RepID=UPI001D0F91F4|nr:DUF6671 family protein [Dermatobacter hominis]UDY37618.1 hypothetical protein LH044_08775 [Dermatobacter hominis]
MTETWQPYAGLAAILATKHGKESTIGPVLASVGLRVETVAVETDRFGTFAGDVPRPGTPDEVVVAKARAGMAAADRTLGLASEGAFFGHPDAPFLTVQAEAVALVDDDRGSVVFGRAQSPATWASAHVVTDQERLLRWCRTIGFPDQHLVVRLEAPDRRSSDHITGVDSLRTLQCAVEAFETRGRVLVEPDLRADRCPLRRPIIAAAAAALAEKLCRRCPRCGVPGFGEVAVSSGRPCGWCHGPTLEVGVRTDGCPASCGHVVERVVPGLADPGSCPRCNP